MKKAFAILLVLAMPSLAFAVELQSRFFEPVAWDTVPIVAGSAGTISIGQPGEITIGGSKYIGSLVGSISSPRIPSVAGIISGGGVISLFGSPQLVIGSAEVISERGFIGESMIAISSVPEPETYVLLPLGLGLLFVVARRRQSSGG